MTDAVRRFSEHLAPITIATTETPPELRRLAVRLVAEIGPHRTAYLFGVARSTLDNWCRRRR
jgi:transposase-like protein